MSLNQDNVKQKYSTNKAVAEHELLFADEGILDEDETVTPTAKTITSDDKQPAQNTDPQNKFSLNHLKTKIGDTYKSLGFNKDNKGTDPLNLL